MPDNSNRNMIVFVILAGLILLGYEYFFAEPQAQRDRAVALAKAKQNPAASATLGTGAPGLGVNVVRVPRAQALAASPRVVVDTPKLSGSIALVGARFDDLHLKAYRQELKQPETVELLRPEGVEFAHFVEFGWNGTNVHGLPSQTTLWTAAAGTTLTPSTPVTLTYESDTGLKFTRVISVDNQYVFTIADTVANTGAAPVTVAPYGTVQRQGLPPKVGTTQIVHEGGIGVLGTDHYELFNPKDLKYPQWQKAAEKDPLPDHVTLEKVSKGGWLGLTDKYWLAAMIPDQKEPLKVKFHVVRDKGIDVFDAEYAGAERTIAPGAQVSSTTHLFAGAKIVPLLQTYEKSLNAPRFDDAVDWGMFFFFTRPIFIFLEFIHGHVGNFGLAILALTISVKALFFPLANKSYESITKMKKLQPLMEEIKKKHGADPTKQQQETMALYQREKVNPLLGCLPMLVQIPVFYSLYKVLTVTIEMRQAPFFGFIHDLSARDPTTIWTLFGLIPWNPATAPMIGTFLDQGAHIGICAIIYGFTMWLTQAMNPPAADPMQQKIFQFLPLIFTFTLSTFAVGLIIYWTWNNLLSILQQYVIMHRFKVDNPIDNIIGRLRGRSKAPG